MTSQKISRRRLSEASGGWRSKKILQNHAGQSAACHPTAAKKTHKLKHHAHQTRTMAAVLPAFAVRSRASERNNTGSRSVQNGKYLGI
jgi:hypothetical protein